MAGTLDLIRDWATQLDYWEQVALEKVAAAAPLSEKDYQELLDLCMQDAGLIAMPSASRPPLKFPTKLIDSGNAAGFIVERLLNLENVNALPEGQEIHFGPQLTVVYGPNGAGKTSYTRPLGCAAFARGEREVLTDARKTASALPTATVEISKNGVKKTVTWKYGSRCPELSGVYVFDSTSISAHLTRPNSLSFSPAGLSLLTRLAEVTDAVRERLRKVIEAKSAAHNFGPYFAGDSSVAREILGLSAKSDLSALEKRAVLTGADEERVATLDKQIAELKSQNIPSRIAALRQEIRDLQTLLANIDRIEAAITASVESEVKSLIEDAIARKSEAERVGADQFKFEQFTQVGTDIWREFIGTAKALADAEAQGRAPYPQTGDACLFCRQTLSPEALALVNRLWEFLSSDAPARHEAAQLACRHRARALREVSPVFFSPDAPAHRILSSEAGACVAAIEAYIAACSDRIEELQSALTSGSLMPFTAAMKPDTAPVIAAIDRRTAEIKKLETADLDKELKALEDEARELLHRRALRDHLGEVKNWVNSQRWAAVAQKAVGSTRHITAKYNDLFKLLVTDQYRDTFQTILHKLKRNLKLTIETKGHKGETVRQIVLSPDVFVQKVAIEKILSDGEKRAVALADFLTEVSLDVSSSAIVLDDPVSSFDSDSKEAVAKLLAEIAVKRQVIIFTHDVGFLHALKVAAKLLSVGVNSHWIRSESGEPGYVYLDNSPICEGDYKSAKIARDCYSRAKTATPAEQERLLQQGFGALRTTYEAFVIYDLFNAVVKRWEERIAFDQLKDVSLDREIVEKVVEKLGTLSRYIDAHLHSDTFAAEKPTPEMLLDEIEGFEQLRKKHKDLKKAAPSAPAKPTAKAVAAPSKEPKPEVVQPNTPSSVN